MREDETDRRLSRLMASAQEGDRSAYARLLSDIAPIIRRAVRSARPFLQPSDVEDVLQDVLLSVHAARATYDPERAFLPWLLAIVRNRAADGARRHLRRASHEVATGELPETFSDPGANEGFGDPDRLRQALAGLPPGQRTALELVKLKEMSLKEAAAASGMSVGALKVAVHRAIQSLRRSMRGEP